MVITASALAAGVGAFAAGGGFSSSGGATGTSGFSDPSLPFRASLLGSIPGSRGKGRIFPGPDFGIFTGAEEQIQDFLFNPVGLFPGEQGLLNTLLGSEEDIRARLQRAEDVFAELQPFALEAAETGFRTDAGPIFDEALRRLKTDFFPQIAETVGAQAGVSSSALIGAGAREGANLFGQAALADIGLAESAANRRLAGIPLAGQVAGTQLALPFAFGQDVLSLGGGFRNVIEEGRGRPLQGLGFLAGLGNQQFIQQGFNPVSQTGQLTGALASFLGSAGGGGTGTASSPFG